MKNNRPPAIWVITLAAVIFGLMTIKSGGSVLFIGGSYREAAGNYVPFVLWFNFLAGFAYIFAGAAIWTSKEWALSFSAIIAGATLLVFLLFGAHALNGGLYETRTVQAMSIRSAMWLIITFYLYYRSKAGTSR